MKTKVPMAPTLLCSLLLAGNAFASDTVFSPSKPSTVFKTINQTIPANTSIDISQFGTVAGLAISGNVSLLSDIGYVRVLMVSTRGDEYLVLETNPLLAKGKQLVLDEYCEETKTLSNVAPALLKIEIANASLMLTSVSVSHPATSAAMQSAAAAAAVSTTDRDAQFAEKLLAVRFSIKQRGLHWVAGDTPVARKSYAEKKRFFGGKVPNLAGLEYYVGGIFQIPSSSSASPVSANAAVTTAAGASPYVSDFSWRNKHGQSWLTGVRDQGGCGSCWAFGSTGATELLTNLYFNRHIDLDLSEQEALSCMSGGTCAGGVPESVLDYITQNGIFEESCFPYTATDQMCSSECSGPVENVKIGGRVPFNDDSEDTLKSMILTSSVSMGIFNWWHVLTLAGYRTLKVGDSFYIRNYDQSIQWITITAADTDLIGKTVWEFKNSWGPLWGDNGYVFVLTDLSNIYLTDKLLPPVTRKGHTNAEILCVDTDKDGYYAWGVGPKPAQCPANSPAQPDGDDSDKCKGPMDAYGNLTSLCTTANADFTASNLSPCIGKSTTFTDLSTGSVTSWSWKFGSGASPANATGKGPFNVTYSTSGSKTVTLSVAGAGGAQDSETKTNYIAVPTICNPVRLEIYARNEAYNETNETKPRIYIANMGSVALSDFKVVFKFTTNGKTPKLEDWYTPYESPSLVNVSGNNYDVVYDYTGCTLNPGAIAPDSLGNVIGLHYTDWATFTITTNFKPGASFALNTDLAVYDKNGALVYGTAQ
jgi:PKD repeat protein